MVDDVILDNGDIPYLHIAKKEQRRIKNPQSQRNVPLHPEVLRLNFIAYVKAIKALGYRLLFPDLYSPSTSSPLGDRFYKDFKPVLETIGVTEKGLGAHAVRHVFGAQLKKNRWRRRIAPTCSDTAATARPANGIASRMKSRPS
jgi:hypothetical protein